MSNLSRRSLVTAAVAVVAAVPACAATALDLLPATQTNVMTDNATAIDVLEREIGKCQARIKELRARLPADFDETDAALIALAEQAIAAHRAHEATCDAITPFEEAMIAWRKANPAPQFPNSGTCAWDAEKGTATFEGLSTAKEQAARERSRQNWRRRERAAEKRTGFAEASRAQGEAEEASSEVAWRLIETRPRSLAGLVAKARAQRIIDKDKTWPWGFGEEIEALAGLRKCE